MKKDVLIVSRAERFSPNAEQRDALFVERLTARLHKEGCRVLRIEEDLLVSSLLKEIGDVECVANMARSHQALSFLKLMEASHVRVCNAPSALLAYPTRVSRLQALARCQVPTPSFMLYEDDEPLSDINISFPLWVKANRLDTPGRHVARVEHATQLADYISKQRESGITSFSLEQHIAGQQLKFYAISSAAFFVCYEAVQTSDCGLRVENVSTNYIPAPTVITNQLAVYAKLIGEHMGLQIFGGDAAIGADGVPYLFDLNDFPSFAPCREEAVEACVQYLLQS